MLENRDVESLHDFSDKFNTNFFEMWKVYMISLTHLIRIFHL